jgi:hypothetical protein
VDRIASSTPNLPNQSYDPNSCEPPTAPPIGPAVVSCPDGSTSDDGICANSGLKGPPNAAQRYLADFATSGRSPEPAVSQDVQKSNDTTDVTTGDALAEMVADAGTAVMDAVRSALANGAVGVGQQIEHRVTLPNGCRARFNITGSIEKDVNGKPELATNVSGSIEAKLGAASAEAKFSYAISSSGREALSLGVCVFGGVDQDAAGLAGVQAKAGLCSTLKGAIGAPATLEVEAVAKAGASIHLFGDVTWDHGFETRTTLSKTTLGYDLLR